MGETFAERLRRIRIERNLTPRQIAAQMGVSRETVSRWQCGEMWPSADRIAKLALVLSVSNDYLLTGREYAPHAALLSAVRAAAPKDVRLAALIERLL